jgi:hypothetical protein
MKGRFMYRITLLAPAGTYKNADDQVLRILEERIAMVLVFHAVLAFISISGILKSKTMFNLSLFEKIEILQISFILGH